MMQKKELSETEKAIMICNWISKGVIDIWLIFLTFVLCSGAVAILVPVLFLKITFGGFCVCLILFFTISYAITKKLIKRHKLNYSYTKASYVKL